MSAVARNVVLVTSLLIVVGATPAVDPLAGVVLDDASGRAWRLDELQGAPVLLVIADRQAADRANDWGRHLGARTGTLAPWRAKGKIAWLSVADLRRVPEFARDAARARVREREAGRSDEVRERISPMLLDWGGLLAERLGAERGKPLVVLLSADRDALVRVHGDPTDEAAERLIEAITRVAAK